MQLEIIQRNTEKNNPSFKEWETPIFVSQKTLHLHSRE